MTVTEADKAAQPYLDRELVMRRDEQGLPATLPGDALFPAVKRRQALERLSGSTYGWPSQEDRQRKKAEDVALLAETINMLERRS